MSASTLQFLLNNNLIDNKLKVNWETWNKISSCNREDVNVDKELNGVIFARILLAVLGVISSGVIGAIFFGIYTHQRIIPPLFMATMLTLIEIFFIPEAISPFLRDIKKLNRTLCCYRKETKFCLCKPISELAELSELTAETWSGLLRKQEITLGIDHPNTKETRMKFKGAHAICAKFGLCKPNQGAYLATK